MCEGNSLKGIPYYDLLEPGQIIMRDLYQMQMILLKKAINKIVQTDTTRHTFTIFHLNNARPHGVRPGKSYLESSDGEVLPHMYYLPYRPELTPSD